MTINQENTPPAGDLRAICASWKSGVISGQEAMFQVTANLATVPPVSAAEQPTGELPPLPEPDDVDHVRWAYTAESMQSYASAAIAAHLARQSPAPEPARPTDDHLWNETLRDRDTYHEWADKLAEAIAKHFGAEIGEHSNMNCPWHEALEVIESVAPVAQEVTQQAAKAETDSALAAISTLRKALIEAAIKPQWAESIAKRALEMTEEFAGAYINRAPTTSTVSASGALAAPDDVRDAKRYRLLRRHVKPGSISLPMRWVPPPLQTIEERIDMLCDAELECTDRAAHAATKSED